MTLWRQIKNRFGSEKFSDAVIVFVFAETVGN